MAVDVQVVGEVARPAVAAVTITVDPVNDTPSATNDAYAVDEDTPLDVPAPGVLANDVDIDGDTLFAVLVQDAAAGTLALGADGIALSNAAMQAIGCLGMRACHTNNCPVGIATQKDHLRRRLEIDKSARQQLIAIEAGPVDAQNRAVIGALRHVSEMPGTDTLLHGRLDPRGLQIEGRLASRHPVEAAGGQTVILPKRRASLNLRSIPPSS